MSDRTLTPDDPALKSFVDVHPSCHFPIQNLPYGVFSTTERPKRRVGVAIGDRVLDLAELEARGVLAPAPSRRVFDQGCLNQFIALGSAAWTETRSKLSELLRHDNPTVRDDAALRSALVPMNAARLHLPLEIPGYTDFYSSREHATNVGRMFRDPKSPLLPNWLEMPVAYNGRASSVVVSGTPVRRPMGQVKPPETQRPVFGASRRLDMELEMAFVIATNSELGHPIPIAKAEEHIFGLVLMNDWSARDIQHWEYLPLGPFNSKSFATSISPWIVTLEALKPFRVEGPRQDPVPLPYLQQNGPRGVNIELEARLRPDGAREATTICRTNFGYMYWSMAQQLAHHTVSGCNVRVGDLLGSGTVSGPSLNACGSLLELALNGEKPIPLGDGTTRSFLEDGDEIAITGFCQGSGYRVGFGEVTGRILPASLS